MANEIVNMIQKIKHTNLSQQCKLSKRALQAREQAFSKNDSRTKFDATINSTYQSQQKKVFATAKITTSVKSVPEVGNS